MTEPEWLACDDPSRLLSWLTGERTEEGPALLPPPGLPPPAVWPTSTLLVRHVPPHPAATDRKLRLFACACCRRLWPLLTDPRSRAAVEAAERYADGNATEAELRSTEAGRWAAVRGEMAPGERPLRRAAAWCCSASRHAEKAVELLPGHVPPAAQAALLRDAVGNPFESAWPSAPLPDYCPACAALGGACDRHRGRLDRDRFRAWLCWRDGTVPRLAQSIYDGRAFDRLPVLADALEEAGCADRAVLDHLRGPGPHVRGCWAIDLLLG
jgi:hypothetical protein